MVEGFVYKEILPFIVMIAIEVLNVGVNTLFKAATSKGMNFYVFAAYSTIVSSLVLQPFVLFFHRRIFIPPLSFNIVGKIFAVGAIGMEKLGLRSSTSQAKIWGTLISILGALVVILYEGPQIVITPSKSTKTHELLHSANSNWIIGGVLLGVGCIINPVSFVLQAHILEEYPAEFAMVFLYGGFATLIQVTVSTIVVPNKNFWALKPDISIVAIFCSGASLSISAIAMSWVVHRKGPFYIAMFKPLSIAIAVVMGIMCLGDTLHAGSIIGASMISFGLYSLMWGKVRESYEDLGNAVADSESYSYKTPFLQT